MVADLNVCIRAYGVSGRVLSPASAPYPPDPASPLEGNIYTSLVHMTLLVQPYSDPALANITYVADMGFGGLGPMRPILFADGGDGDEQELPAMDIDEAGSSGPRCKGGWVWGTFPPVRHRVVRGAHYSSSLGEQSSRCHHCSSSLLSWCGRCSH